MPASRSSAPDISLSVSEQILSDATETAIVAGCCLYKGFIAISSRIGGSRCGQAARLKGGRLM